MRRRRGHTHASVRGQGFDAPPSHVPGSLLSLRSTVPGSPTLWTESKMLREPFSP